MVKDLTTVNIKVYGQEFKIRAGEDEKDLVQEAAELATKRMQQISESGIVTIHRVAIMAAFQFAFELVQLKNSVSPDSGKLEDKTRVDNLIKRIDKALK